MEAPETAETKNKLSKDRTDLAEDRTLLANERTFAGWARTALAAIGLGLGFQAIFRETEPTWVAKSIATLFEALGAFVIWRAERRLAAVLHRISKNSVEPMGRTNFRGITLVICTGALLTVGAIWFLV